MAPVPTICVMRHRAGRHEAAGGGRLACGQAVQGDQVRESVAVPGGKGVCSVLCIVSSSLDRAAGCVVLCCAVLC